MEGTGADLSLVRNFETLERSDVALVGGKNSSLGEMIRALGEKGIAVPPGFATTSKAYGDYLDENCLREKIAELVANWQLGKLTLAESGYTVRKLFLYNNWLSYVIDAIRMAYSELSIKVGVENLSIAVCSSAIAEDLPEACFAN